MILRDITLAGDGGTVNCLAYDGDDDKLLCTGTTVPADGGSGYSKGGIFIKTNAASGTKALYENQGTNTSCIFNMIGDPTNALQVNPATVATTGNTDGYVIAPETGTLSSIDFSGVDALATSDTNYITYSVTNLGQDGAGSTAMLAATDANTTKATGGSAIAANAKRALTLHGTAANLAVTAGDRLRIRAAATGTLANTVTFPAYLLRFAGTT